MKLYEERETVLPHVDGIYFLKGVVVLGNLVLNFSYREIKVIFCFIWNALVPCLTLPLFELQQLAGVQLGAAAVLEEHAAACTHAAACAHTYRVALKQNKTTEFCKEQRLLESLSSVSFPLSDPRGA